MVCANDIEVVLPAFNGAGYIHHQIESVFNQSIRPARLLVWDDCSLDHTRVVLDKLACKYGSWLCIYQGDKNIGCSEALNRLVAMTSAPYIALCDQDDIWEREHLEFSLMLMQSINCRYGSLLPLLVHSDPSLIDANGKSISNSFWKFSDIRPDNTSFAYLSFFNIVTGCTCLLNRALVSRAFPIPDCALVHDWWIALVASQTGKIRYSRVHTVLYRQHSSNLIGAKRSGLLMWFRSISRFRSSSTFLNKLALQQETFLRLHRVQSSSYWHILDILSSSFAQRLCLFGICIKSGWRRSLSLWLSFVLYKN